MKRIVLVACCAILYSVTEAKPVFEDVTAATGITFVHNNGAYERHGEQSRLMPETMGSGVGVIDYDGDGDVDIVFLNGSKFYGSGGHQSTIRLYENLGNWKFKDVSSASGLGLFEYAMGICVVDIDGDYDEDIFVSTLTGLKYFENNNGRFSDRTSNVGLQLSAKKDVYRWATGLAIFDLDQDDDLDIVSAEYVDWAPDKDVYISLDQNTKAYSTPRAYAGRRITVFKNNGNRFMPDPESIISEREMKALGLAVWDFNDDGKLDVVVANDTVENALFLNKGGGKFVDKSVSAGIAYGDDGTVRAGMGIDIADFDNNGLSSVVIGNFSGESTSYFKQKLKDRLVFQDINSSSGIKSITSRDLTFGVIATDFDLDGWIDIFAANGHVEPGIQDIFHSELYKQPVALLRNEKNGTFSRVKGETESLNLPIVGRGVAQADIDGDGDLDYLLSANNGRPLILKNLLSDKRYVRIKLIGHPPNTQAIGAKIEAVGLKYTQRRFVTNGGSYLSHSEYAQTFGFEHDDQLLAIVITWPNGKVHTMKTPELNKTYEIPLGYN